MREEPLQIEQGNKEVKRKKFLWIIIIGSSLIIIGILILIVFLVKNKKDKDSVGENKTNPQPSEPSSEEEELGDYDKLCLLL